MDQTHVHLLITHLPIFGSFLGIVVLLHGLWTKSDQTKIAAYNLFIISGIGACVAYLTGEGAEETVENLPGIVDSTIENHEDFAVFALTSLIILGVVALVGVVMTLRKSPQTKPVTIVVLSIALVAFGLVARTGYLGGQIRHTEITVAATNQGQGVEESEDDD